MEVLEVEIEKCIRDAIVSGKGKVMYMGCFFTLNREGWMKVENMNVYCVRVFIPEINEDEQKKEYYISSTDTALIPIHSWKDLDWSETMVLLKENKTRGHMSEISRVRRGEGTWKNDFYEISMKEDEMKIRVNHSDINRIVLQTFHTCTKDIHTRYTGELIIENGKRIIPWNNFMFSVKQDFNYKIIVAYQEKKEENSMGIISTLLTGGILIGKVCQVIASGIGSLVQDEQTGARLAENYIEFDDMRIGMYSATANGEMKLHAFNCSGKEKTIQFPADKNGNSLMYSIPGTCKQEIATQLSKCESPDESLQLATITNEGDGHDGVVSAKIHIENLVIGEEGSLINVYGYCISADESGILILGEMAGDMTYCELRTKSGINLTVNQTIKADILENQKTKYSLNFQTYGILKGEHLSGMLQFNTSVDTWEKLRTKNLKNMDIQEATPFTEAEVRLLRKVGALK